MNPTKLEPPDGIGLNSLRGTIRVTRRGLIRILATAVTAARSGWATTVFQLKPKGHFVEAYWTSLQPRSMFFSLRSPQVQILCSIERTVAVGRVQAVRVNDEPVPGWGTSDMAGSYWKYNQGDLIIYVEQSVVHYNLSRFPDVEVLLTAD